MHRTVYIYIYIYIYAFTLGASNDNRTLPPSYIYTRTSRAIPVFTPFLLPRVFASCTRRGCTFRFCITRPTCAFTSRSKCGVTRTQLRDSYDLLFVENRFVSCGKCDRCINASQAHSIYAVAIESCDVSRYWRTFPPCSRREPLLFTLSQSHVPWVLPPSIAHGASHALPPRHTNRARLHLQKSFNTGAHPILQRGARITRLPFFLGN